MLNRPISYGLVLAIGVAVAIGLPILGERSDDYASKRSPPSEEVLGVQATPATAIGDVVVTCNSEFLAGAVSQETLPTPSAIPPEPVPVAFGEPLPCIHPDAWVAPPAP
jgi:hypothetical protein